MVEAAVQQRGEQHPDEAVAGARADPVVVPLHPGEGVDELEHPQQRDEAEGDPEGGGPAAPGGRVGVVVRLTPTTVARPRTAGWALGPDRGEAPRAGAPCVRLRA